MAITRSTTEEPEGAVIDRTSQTSWTTCSSPGSVNSTQWAPLPRSTPVPRGVPRFHDQRRLPSCTPTPSIITHHTSPAHAVATCRNLDCILTLLWVTAAGAGHSWGPRGNGVARATFVRRHRAAIASGVALTVAAGCRRGLRRLRERLQEARGRAQRRRHLGRQRQAGLVGPAQQADQPARRCRARRGRQGPPRRRPGRRRGRHPQHRLQPRASPSRPAGSSRRTAASAAIPTAADVRMAGGTLATADPETGELWAVRYDAELGRPVMTRGRPPGQAARQGRRGARRMAVSQGGTIVVTSADEGTVTTLDAHAAPRFGKPTTRDLPGDAGQVSRRHHGGRAHRHPRRRTPAC